MAARGGGVPRDAVAVVTEADVADLILKLNDRFVAGTTEMTRENLGDAILVVSDAWLEAGLELTDGLEDYLETRAKGRMYEVAPMQHRIWADFVYWAKWAYASGRYKQ